MSAWRGALHAVECGLDLSQSRTGSAADDQGSKQASNPFAAVAKRPQKNEKIDKQSVKDNATVQ